MNPAPSIIFFTTASGAGYGLLFWLGLLRPARMVPDTAPFGLLALGVALLLVTAGLLSSLLHLGRPERAWRALSQWRSSWLSREGVAALATYPMAILFGLSMHYGWSELAGLFGFLTAIGAVVTVWSTGMIYASLKPIRQWHQPLVGPGYLLFAAFSGAALMAALGALAGRATIPSLLTMMLGIAALLLKYRYWQAIDAPAPAGTPTIESATGLGAIGRTRPLDPPHTEQNWLLREMGYRIARKHRDRLRSLVLAGFGLAAVMAFLSIPIGGPAEAVVLALAALTGLLALVIERWLMFAEATHSVTLFYTGEA